MHNIQTLLYGAGMGGDLRNAEAYAEIFKSYPERFGPTYMADGEFWSAGVCRATLIDSV